MLNKLKNMNPEAMSYYTINMNSFSDAPSLQVILEQVRFGAMEAGRAVLLSGGIKTGCCALSVSTVWMLECEVRVRDV